MDWIPCSERLPPISNTHILYVTEQDRDGSRKVRMAYYYGKGVWQSDLTGWIPNVVAWSERPLPYSGPV
jgi:hypothetical protein